jgi:hypothetical protein
MFDSSIFQYKWMWGDLVCGEAMNIAIYDDDVTYLPTLNIEIFWCCQKIRCVYDSV